MPAKLFIPAVMFLLLCLSCGDQPLHSQSDQTLQQVVQEYYAEGAFNGTVLVIKGEEVLLNKAYGFADGSKEYLLDPNAQFGIGSIYKEFPAVSIMMLVEDGLLNLEDPIRKHLPDLPTWATDITLEHLLQYTSGLPKINFGKYFGQGIPISDSDIWNDILAIETLEFKPGTDYLYANNGPLLLTKIVEQISEMSFQEFMDKRLFQPSGMEHTAIKDQYPYSDMTLMANPFNTEGEIDQYAIRSCNMLITSTALDLAKWARRLNDYELINKASVRYLSKTAELENDNMQAPLGNCIHVDDEIKEHTHHGSMGNYEGIVKRYNDRDITIVLLTNHKNGNVFEITKRLYDSIVVE